MIFANLIVIEEAVVEMATDSVSTVHSKEACKLQMDPKFDISTIVVLCFGTAMKLVLFLICRVRASTASQCLAIDHRNDCITNMVALAGALVGSKWWKYADPIFGGFIRYQSLTSGAPILCSFCIVFDFYNLTCQSLPKRTLDRKGYPKFFKCYSG